MGMRGERDGGRFAVYSERVPAFLSNRVDPPANFRRSSANVLRDFVSPLLRSTFVFAVCCSVRAEPTYRLIREIALLEKLRYSRFREIPCVEIVAYDPRGVSSPSSSGHGRSIRTTYRKSFPV